MDCIFYWRFGELGDSFNIITSLFTGLAFAGVIVSVVLQTQELKLQRRELRENTSELKGQKEQLEKQAQHLEKQQQEMVSQSFDNKFFQMLNMFNTNVETFGAYDNSISKYIKGKAAIGAILRRFYNNYSSNSNSNSNSIEDFERFIAGEDSATVKAYCIGLYQILKYVDKHAPKKSIFQSIININSLFNKNQENKLIPKEYTNVIRSQLSADELILLMCNAIVVIQYSGKKYKELLEKYAFFEHLSVNDLNTNTIFIDNILKEYNSKVAGKNTALKEKIKELKKND